MGINKQNVGRIAERIVSNELEYRGYRVSDLNKEGTSANADLLAAKDGQTWQIQVKGSTEENGWWFGYGQCTDLTMAGEEPMFNRHSASKFFYKAEVVVLVSVKSPVDYRCLVLPVDIAEQAAQINLDWAFRTPRLKDGLPKKPGKVWVSVDWVPKTADAAIARLRQSEVDLLTPYRDRWELPEK
ncbi:MAG TPA: hypothetical protein VGN17_00285 [Bryobacteraceae bacterium]